MTNLNVTGQYNSKDFFSVASASNTRVVAKDGKVEAAGFFDKGSRLSTICNLADGHSTGDFLKENKTTGAELGIALKNDFDHLGDKAFSIVRAKAWSGEPITQRDVAEIKRLVPQLQINAEQFNKLTTLFRSVASDNRFIEVLKHIAPGEKEGGARGLAEKYVMGPIDVMKDSHNHDDVVIQKLSRKESTENLMSVGKFVLSVLIPPLGLAIAMHKICESSDKEAAHGAILSVLAQEKSGLKNDFASALANTLYGGHEKDATNTAAKLTVTTTTLPLGTVMTGTSLGMGEMIKEQIAEAACCATTAMVAKAGYSSSIAVAKQGVNYTGVAQLAEMAGNDGIREDLSILPRMEVADKDLHQSFDLHQNANVVRALLLYLGPEENSDITENPDTPKEWKDLENARMELKRELGSFPQEDLIPGDQTQIALKDHNKALMESLSFGALHNPLKGNRQFHSTFLDDLQRDTSEPAKSKAFIPLEKREIERAELMHDYPQEDGTKGTPSALRMLYAAEGWL